jgi:steroid delta-isomerase-like uncharacterized protein
MKKLLALLVLAPVLLNSCMKKDAATASMDIAMKAADSSRNANIAGYNAVGQMFSTGKFDDMGKYIADNYIEHQLMPGQKPGLAGLKEMMTGFRAAFPDMKFTTNHITADSGSIWAHFTMTGTNTGSFMGMPATGKKINVDGIDLLKIVNGKAVEHWGYMDEHAMMQQLGLAPADPATATAEAPAAK